MYILQVIPFAKTLRKEHLSYFSKDPVELGSIVSINLRKRVLQGLVISCTEGKDMKSELKASEFALRKIKKVHKQTLFRNEFITAASRIGRYFATTTGPVIRALTPMRILEEIDALPNVDQPSKHIKAARGEKLVIQETDDDRYSNYKALIREEFAKKRSVLFICPTIEDTVRASQLLYKGIEDSTFIFHSKLTRKQALTEWKECLKHEKPVLIIVTGTFLGIPRHDIGSVIVEKESMSSYHLGREPYIDIRLCAEYYAEEIGARFFLGDLMLRSETLYRYNNHQLYERNPLQFRALSTSQQHIIDMKAVKNEKGEKFAVLSDELKGLVTKTKEDGKNMFIYSVRKGLAPSVVCMDCNTIVSCPNCTKGLVLYGKDATKEGNVLRCHSCGFETSAGKLCEHCNSWRLQTLGIGTDLIAQEVAKSIPKDSIFILDSERATTPKQARDIIEGFYKKPGSVLIGTDMALIYLHDPVEHTAVASLDSLFSIPEFYIRERIMNTLLKIRSKTTETALIQTRRADDSIFEFIQNGNIAEFYREELHERKEFDFPPYTLMIKITLAGAKADVTKAMEELKPVFAPHEFHIYQAFTERVKQKYVMNGIIRLKRDQWVDELLLRKLLNLPPQFRIIVGTESLL